MTKTKILTNSNLPPINIILMDMKIMFKMFKTTMHRTTQVKHSTQPKDSRTTSQTSRISRTRSNPSLIPIPSSRVTRNPERYWLNKSAIHTSKRKWRKLNSKMQCTRTPKWRKNMTKICSCSPLPLMSIKSNTTIFTTITLFCLMK